MKLKIGPIQLQVGHDGGREGQISDGCTEAEISDLETRFGVRLPSPYRRFLSRFGRDRHLEREFRGAHYEFPLLSRLRGTAEELLSESNIGFVLHRQDFVFWMLQGYIFYFFRADGQSDDPPVFGYMEGEAHPKQVSPSISAWLRGNGVRDA